MASNLNRDKAGLWAEQDKDAFLDYSLDWAADGWLPPGDTLASSTWTADAALTLNSATFTPNGVASVWVQGGQANTWYALTNSVVSTQGRRDQRTIRLLITDEADSGNSGTALFPNPIAAIEKMKRDRLLLLARSALPGVDVSDEYIWDKLTAAESLISHELRVPLGPTRFFPVEPTQAQIDALAGKPWAIDPAYDWEPENFLGNKWGYLLLRNKPIIDVISIRVAFPAVQNTVIDIPSDWVRLDKKYGHLNLVPSSPMAMQTFGVTLIPMISGGRKLPFSVHINYTAGLQNVQRDYPELLDVVFKQAAIGIIEDSYLPQSGSISADGLSQSMSVDTGKYYDTIDRVLHGREGNGGLMAKIHGIRTMVL